jgi:hypothetical protein
MKKLAFMFSSTNLTIGNDFTNYGILNLTKTIFSNINEPITYEIFEIYDTVTDNGISFNPSIENYLNTFDYIIISAGSLISEEGINIIKSYNRLRPVKILMSISCLIYSEVEEKYCKEIENLRNFYFFTKDKQTYKLFSNTNKNVYNGIDAAFYLSDYYKKGIKINPYAVINLDNISDNISSIMLCIKALKRKYKRIYVIENTYTRYRNIEKLRPYYIYVSNWIELYKIYQNAAFVVTNRIYSALASMSNAVDFRFFWSFLLMNDCKNIFNRLGIDLIKNETFESKRYLSKIDYEKKLFMNSLNDFFNNKI